MACEPFLEQEDMVPAIFGFLTEVLRSHPRLTRRVAALTQAGSWPDAPLRSRSTMPNGETV